MDVQIKRLEPGDEGVLECVAEGVFDEAVDTARLTAYLAEPNHYLMVALKAGQVVGQVAAVVHKHPDKPDELFIDEVGVAPVWQRQGIATRMLDAMLELGKTLGCPGAWLATEEDNEPGRALYESFGVQAEPIVMYAFSLEGGGA